MTTARPGADSGQRLPGNYFLTGKLFHQGAPVLEQTFQFDKMGGL